MRIYQRDACTNVQRVQVPVNDARRPIFAARDLAVSLERTKILHGLSFSVQGPRLVGLLGPNGSGKTTLLRTMGGLLPYQGQLDLRGRPVRAWQARELARALAFVRQSVSLSFDFTVSELVLLGRSPHKSWLQDYGQSDRDRMRSALEMVDLVGFEDRSVLTLSGGELQRVFLAQALVQEATVLLLDEPTAHLDVHFQFEFMEMVRDLVSRGRTVVAVFHDLEMAARYADDLLVLQRGRLASAGQPSDVLSRELIAEVFRMEARIERTAGEGIHIRFVTPLGRAPRPTNVHAELGDSR